MKASQASLSAVVVLALKAGDRGAQARDLGATEGHAVAGEGGVLPSNDKGGIRGSTEVLQTERGYLSTDGGDGLRVHELYTFGAPSVSRWPITAKGDCVKGLRLYTENVMDWSWPHPADFAAMWNQDLGHPKMDMLMLNNRQSKFWNHTGGHNTAKYLYYPCKDSEGNKDHYWWPKNQHSNMDIHGMNEAYLPRLKYFFYGTRWWEQDETYIHDLLTQTPIDDGVPGKLIKDALLYGLMAQMNYWEVDAGDYEWHIKQGDTYRLPPGWEVVKKAKIWSGAAARDKDNIRLLKHDNTTECVFTFEGSNQETNGGRFYDLGRFTGPGAGDMVTWCGKENLHRGVKDELWTIVHDEVYAGFRPELAACSKVICAGHSLGGALCDMWTHLANNGVEDSTDTDCWTKLAW